MNTAVRLLERARRAGIHLDVDDNGKLTIDFNGIIARHVLEELHAHQSELCALLRPVKRGDAPTMNHIHAMRNRDAGI